MKVTSVTNGVLKKQNIMNLHPTEIGSGSSSNAIKPKQVSFKGAGNLTKKFWMKFRNLSDTMKEASELTNAIIVFIGTGLIAPFAIMCSPSKKCKKCKEVEEPKNTSKKAEFEKKFFQAVRQPVSAFLALAFQIPTTFLIKMGLDRLTYKTDKFNDKEIGRLIPNQKYLKDEAEKVLKSSASAELTDAWKQELELVKNRDALRSEFMEKIRQNYKEVGIDVDDATLQKMANNEKKLRKFIAEKMAGAKKDRLLSEKVQELLHKKFNIKDIDLVTEDYQTLAKSKYSADIKTLRQNAKLNWFDKFIELIGISNKKLSNLAKAEKDLVKEKGLELMKQDIPEAFTDNLTRLKKFIENKNIKAQKIHANKIFWITLATNLVMVGISCVALNWLHPKFADFIDTIRGKKGPNQTSAKPKVEVKA